MVEVLNKPPKPFAWSFTAVSNFHTCGKLYYHRSVKKDVSDDTSYRDEGGKIHDILRDAVRGTHPLPDHLKRWQRWIDELNADKVKVIAEMKMAFTDRAQPCDYFDKSVQPWCRLNLDVLKLYPTERRALVWDWKTGKMKPDDDQLMLYAMGVFVRWLIIDTVDAALIFLKEDHGPSVPRNNCTYELRISRNDVIDWWSSYRHKVAALKAAIRTNDFPARPSGLCRAHCPVTSCEHNGHHS